MKLRRALAFALVIALMQPFFVLAPMREVRASGIVCGVPGNDGAGGTLTAGVYNSYWAGTGILSAGSTSVTLGSPDTSAGGSATMPIVGDELLIIQMQDGSFNTSNSSAYGSGGATGSGLTSVGTAGLYEYVVVTAISGSTYSIESTGAGNGLLNTYTEAAATSSTTIKTYQIVRVPEYTTAKLSSNFRAAYWDGATGGIAALDVATGLNLGAATISAVGDGFRGGAFTSTGTTPTSVLNNDWEDSSLMNGLGNVPGQGSKGEGILGTPAYVFEYTDFTAPAMPAGPTTPAPASADGYPGGDMAMGAPGNAGGGGTDDDPVANDENTGGGGGANGGSGGKGGYPWTPDYNGNNSEYSTLGVHAATGYSTANSGDIGGRGGSALSAYVSAAQIFMGGGGGAGVNNNASDNNTYNGYGSSGGVGGGMVLLRINGTGDSSTATIDANGTTGLAPLNDGGGGGGAGGTIVVTAPTAIGGTITAHAIGAAGTTANATNTGGYSQQHGPGGGGGGGVVLSSSSVTATVTAGAAGTTTTMATTYGATAGAAGYKATITAAEIPGISSGAECTSTGNVAYTGPVDVSGTNNYGSADTGSYDGASLVSNNDDFTARDLFLGAAISTTNTGTSVSSPTGASLSLATAPTVSIPNMEYDVNGTGRDEVTLTATAPTGWTVELCTDTTGVGTGTKTTTTPSTPDCNYPTTTTANCTATADQGKWMTPPAAGATSTLSYCLAANTTLTAVYWAVYTAPKNGLIPYSRYDASIELTDTTAFNYTHNEIYASYVPLFKSASVVTSGCPPGVTPTLPTSDPTGAKVCHGGIIQYTVDYRNIIAGAGQGTEGALAAAFDETTAGSLVITDNGTLSTVSQTTTSNWGTFTNGLTEALTAGLANNTTCGTVATTCGDTTTGTTFTTNTVGSKQFTATVGGAAFRLYPMGFAGQTGQGTITFAVKVL